MSTLREQFIERLIREIFLRKGSGFVLKGGAAMRSLLGDRRLTKDVDLDFTNPKRSAASLHNTLRRAIAAAARGLPLDDLTISTPGKDELSPRWKVNYDLDLLLPATAPSAEQIRWAIERAALEKQDAVEVLGARLDALTWQRFQTDLRDALPEHIAERIDEAEWSSMKGRVREGVQCLLEAAAVGRS